MCTHAQKILLSSLLALYSGNKFLLIITGGAYTIQEDPRAALQRYKNALKDGFVSANIMKILIIGAAGVGKTHLLRLLLSNKQPPLDVRHSTLVMERPIQVIQTTLKHSSFESVTDKELYELLARTVNKTAADSKMKPVVNSVMSPVSNNVGTTKSTLKGSVDVHSNSQNFSQKSKKEYTSYTIDPPVLSEVEEKMVPYIAETKGAEPIRDVDWMYFIDSGGQPQFHQLLPAFIHHTNLNIFVLRLCDKLSDHPTDKYYERGTCISSTPSLLTNKEILQRCAQATQTVDQDGVSKLLIVGTHRDLEDQCHGETRIDKNKKLLELLIPSMKGHLMYFKADGSELIYPLNAKHPNEDDRKLSADLCQAIWSIKMLLVPQKIPLRWLVFHQEIQALSKKTNVVVVSLQECSQMAIRLHMVDDTKAALKFFSDLNVIMYYPSILPDVVFTNPQCILNIISEIVKCVAFDRTKHWNSMLVRANNEGIISEKLFDNVKIEFPKIYKEGIIKSKDLITLMIHLGIASQCEDKDEYFMPTLLNTLETQRVQSIFSVSSDPIAPIALYHEKGWFKCGSFNFLITSLLSSKHWTLAKIGSALSCVYSNCIKMCFKKSCNVTLLDNVSYIAVHLEGDIDIMREVCPEIKRYLVGVLEEGVQITFLCPCKHFGDKHLAILTEASLKNKKVLCPKDTKTFCLPESAEIWIQESKQAGKNNEFVVMHAAVCMY